MYNDTRTSDVINTATVRCIQETVRNNSVYATWRDKLLAFINENTNIIAEVANNVCMELGLDNNVLNMGYDQFLRFRGIDRNMHMQQVNHIVYKNTIGMIEDILISKGVKVDERGIGGDPRYRGRIRSIHQPSMSGGYNAPGGYYGYDNYNQLGSVYSNVPMGNTHNQYHTPMYEQTPMHGHMPPPTDPYGHTLHQAPSHQIPTNQGDNSSMTKINQQNTYTIHNDFSFTDLNQNQNKDPQVAPDELDDLIKSVAELHKELISSSTYIGVCSLMDAFALQQLSGDKHITYILDVRESEYTGLSADGAIALKKIVGSRGSNVTLANDLALAIREFKDCDKKDEDLKYAYKYLDSIMTKVFLEIMEVFYGETSIKLKSYAMAYKDIVHWLESKEYNVADITSVVIRMANKFVNAIDTEVECTADVDDDDDLKGESVTTRLHEYYRRYLLLPYEMYLGNNGYEAGELNETDIIKVICHSLKADGGTYQSIILIDIMKNAFEIKMHADVDKLFIKDKASGKPVIDERYMSTVRVSIRPHTLGVNLIVPDADDLELEDELSE